MYDKQQLAKIRIRYLKRLCRYNKLYTDQKCTAGSEDFCAVNYFSFRVGPYVGYYRTSPLRLGRSCHGVEALLQIQTSDNISPGSNDGQRDPLT